MVNSIEGGHKDSKPHKDLPILVEGGSEDELDDEIHAMHDHMGPSDCTSSADPWGSLISNDYWCSK